MESDPITQLSQRVAHLERTNRRWRLVAVLITLVITAWILLPHALRTAHAQNSTPPVSPSDDDEAIARKRLELAREALQIIQRKTAFGPQVSHPVDDTYRWSVLHLGSQIYLSMGKDEMKVEDPEVYLAVAKAHPDPKRLAAFQAHYDLMKFWENRVRPLAEKTIMARLDFYEIQKFRLQAELWLAREKMKTAVADAPKVR
jgi:hypothetical protein